MKRTYVIGDIHGCYREFKQLLELCSDDADGKPARLITLGDYVDRGSDSFGVVQLICHRLAGEYPVFRSIINLKGNHKRLSWLSSEEAPRLSISRRRHSAELIVHYG